VLGDEELAGRGAQACGQDRFVEFFNYPIRVLLQMFAAAMPGLAQRHGDAEQALWLLGHCAAMDFLESESGRTLQVLVRGEPKRLVNNLPWAYQVAMTGERSVKWLGPQSCRFTMQRDFLPAGHRRRHYPGRLDRPVGNRRREPRPRPPGRRPHPRPRPPGRRPHPRPGPPGGGIPPR
jgi:uncharacterized protein (TIGR02265 family)